MHDPVIWRVATFNIWNRQGPWDRRLWPSDHFAVVADLHAAPRGLGDVG
jgi:hypothetical protein